VAALPEETRGIFELYYGHGLSDRDIAERLGIKTDAVKHRRDRALKQLRARLPGDGTWCKEGVVEMEGMEGMRETG
jgi:DNA-directed RNA polymerase specialized sigma24 family protein